MRKDIDWFKETVAPSLQGFKIDYFFFENGDFGDLNRVEIEGNGKGGNIDFWEKDWIEIHLYDYNKDEELIHSLLEPTQDKERDELLVKFESLLKV